MPHPASCAGFVAGAAPEQMLDRQVGHGKAGDREAGAVMGIGPVASTADRSLSIAAKVLNHLCRCPNRLAPLPVIDPAALFPGFEQAGLLHYLELGSGLAQLQPQRICQGHEQGHGAALDRGYQKYDLPRRPALGY